MTSNLNIYAIIAITCLQSLCSSVLAVVGQYIYASYLKNDPLTSNMTLTMPNNSFQSSILQTTSNNMACGEDPNSTTSQTQIWAQQRSADLFFWINLSNGIPVIIMTYILGLYTPKLGVRIVALLPMFGTVIQLSIWLAIIYFHLLEYWWIISSIILGLTGSIGVLNLVLLLIIIEGTVESKRSSRIVLIVSITTGVGAGASSGIGYYIAWRGFIDLFWAALISQLLSIIITIRYIKPSHFKSETRERSESTTSLLTKSHDGPKTSPLTWAHVFQIVTVFAFKRRSKKKSICIYLTMISYAFNVFIGSSSAAFLWYLLNVPFCWSSFEIGNYIAVFAITSAVFTLVSMRMLTHIGVSDPFICAIGYICLFTSTIWIALAEHKWEMYAALIIGSFSTYQNSLTWTMLSKWLEPHERSKAFTFFTDLSALMTTLGSSFFNWLYARTVVYYRGTTLIFAASLAIIPFILNICLLLVTRYMTDDRFGRLSISEIDIETTSSDLLTDVLPETDSDMIDLSDSSPPLLIEFIHQSCIN
ncbi:unnamed protein product [Adineta steineri]|uniref:Proton-coupled folate transporter n=1 Tax=Adineta steineri TaxID=433720 RepID=A0A819K7C2_9BILA|nr:unnamed protein product [Adineta steineri]CAF3941042.1 unnamed protein product [Adineta steineri]